ncbi:MAG TPA: tRNA (adenosine(37)-N6)-threonylcarbamoyltransferase complex ATPase subunit type 1 TsaE [Crocinitomix sp.]|nr:tRNA (adenosine(37)-N6)-threonylcarbamoyltransferase complex ATPase subunit type 1 TsaE [Crocinitomix sp.]
MKIRINNLTDLHLAAKQFLEFTKNHHIFAFYGKMGAGKTTFINAILKQMKIEDHSSSPTFSIINQYLSPTYGTVYHFDFYRIENEIEALDIGIEEIIYGNEYCFIEWPSKIENLLPENTVNININVEDERRILDIEL